jgi:predicted nucleic acid-binding protein
VRLVVADTSVVFPAVLSPSGLRRKLLVLLAYGRLSAYARFGEDEELAQRQEARPPGSVIGGRPITEFLDEARAKKARLEEQLPSLAPDDLCLAGSRPLFDEYEKVLDERGSIVVPDFSGREALAARRRLIAITQAITPDFDLDQVPTYTDERDRDDDKVIHTALLARADFIVSDDRHISVDPTSATAYCEPSGDAVVNACRFDHFVENHVNSLHFELPSIDGSLLWLAYELLGVARP